MEGTGTATDPVCGMTVNTRTAEYRSFHGDQTYYFCSAGCKERFDKDPDKYLARDQGEDVQEAETLSGGRTGRDHPGGAT